MTVAAAAAEAAAAAAAGIVARSASVANIDKEYITATVWGF